MRFEPNSSLGLAGIGPLVITSSSVSPNGCKMSSRLLRPVSQLVRPAPLRKPRYSATIGRRRSASIRTTRCPVFAQARARLVASVVLPSPDVELVIKTEAGMPVSLVKLRLVRTLR